MKKLLGIVVLGLLLSGNAYSKIIDLHCKYITGHVTEKIPHPGHTDSEANTTFIPISDTGIEDYKIKLDTTKEKIIEAPGYSSDRSSYSFSDESIAWLTTDSESILQIKFTLNRYTGQLKEYHKHYAYGDTENNYWMSLVYDCSFTKRLF